MALTDSEKSLLARVPTGLFIDGKWRDASDGRTIDVEDPSTGETLATRGGRHGRRRRGRSGRSRCGTGGLGRHRRRVTAARSCAGRSS